jgi:hypothetical protein
MRPRKPWPASIACAAAALLVASLPGAALAAQTTPTSFGANLEAATPASGVTCETLGYLYPTCTLFTSADSLGGTGESFIVPQGPDSHGSGTISAFHVKVGAYTGPMQIVLMQALREVAKSAACCTVVDVSPWFTPGAGTVTTIPVDWPTENDNVPNPEDNVYAFDTMAITVGEGVAVPVAEHSGAVDTFFAPACPGSVGTECDVYGGDERYVVTMSADWSPSAEPAPAPTPTGPAPTPPPPTLPATPGIAFPHGVARVRNGVVLLPLTCSSAQCVGSVLLQNFRRGTAVTASGAASRRRLTTYGHATFTIGAGAHADVRVRLDGQGRRLLGRRRSVVVYANVTLRGGRAVSLRITLRR